MEIMEHINKLIEQVKNDPALQDEFKKDPVKTTEKVLGVDLPDEMLEKVIATAKAKLTAENISEVVDEVKEKVHLGDVTDALKKFF